VELLVVIAIIALLISILLPSLSKARQQAALVYDASNMKQIMNSVLMYAAENKGRLPYHSLNDAIPVVGSTQSQFNAYGNGTNDLIFVTLSKYQSRKMDTSATDSIGQVFRCYYALESGQGTLVWAPQVIRTVSFNIRAFPNYEITKPTDPWAKQYPQRNIGSIKNASEKIAVWEAPQVMGWNATTIPTALMADGWRYSWGHKWTEPSPNDWDQPQLNAVLEKDLPNNDSFGGWAAGESVIRYRHMPVNDPRKPEFKRGTQTLVAYFDGHAEPRRIGTIKVGELCISNPNPVP